jgi:hypothetical protein
MYQRIANAYRIGVQVRSLNVINATSNLTISPERNLAFMLNLFARKTLIHDKADEIPILLLTYTGTVPIPTESIAKIKRCGV